jgi:hypothetical protein
VNPIRKQAVGNRQLAFGNSAFQVIADLSLTFSDVRYVPIADMVASRLKI